MQENHGTPPTLTPLTPPDSSTTRERQLSLGHHDGSYTAAPRKRIVRAGRSVAISAEDANRALLSTGGVGRLQLSPAARGSFGRLQNVQGEYATRAVRALRAQRLDELLEPEPTRLHRPP